MLYNIYNNIYKFSVILVEPILRAIEYYCVKIFPREIDGYVVTKNIKKDSEASNKIYLVQSKDTIEDVTSLVSIYISPSENFNHSIKVLGQYISRDIEKLIVLDGPNRIEYEE